jgi:hypothetical protein
LIFTLRHIGVRRPPRPAISQALAVDAELPAVVHAAQAVVLVAREDHRRAAVRAGVVDQADPAAAVAEGDEVLASRRTRCGWPSATARRARRNGIQY